MAIDLPQLGYHYFPDDRHYTASDLNCWLPIMKDLGAQWVTLQGRTSHAIPERFVRSLIDSGIKPILHLPADVDSIDLRDVTPLLQSYANWGVHHVTLYDRPNLRDRWKGHTWSRDRLVERFLDRAIPCFNLQIDLGMHPMFPPLEPGGDYWDTAFLRSALVSIARRGEDHILDALMITGYAWTYGHSLSWGAGGPSRWPESRPYHTPEESQDQVGFRVFDWYEHVSAQLLGEPLPIAILAGGPTDAVGRPNVNVDMCIEQARGILRILRNGGIPETVRSICFYPFVVDRRNPAHEQAWFSENRKISRIGEAAREILDLPPLPSSADKRKSIEHYLLLPHDFGRKGWRSVGSYLENKRVTAGFSLKEARRADHVTILSSESWGSKDVEDDLRRAGCTLDWLVPEGDSYIVQPSTSSRENHQKSRSDVIIEGAAHG